MGRMVAVSVLVSFLFGVGLRADNDKLKVEEVLEIATGTERETMRIIARR